MTTFSKFSGKRLHLTHLLFAGLLLLGAVLRLIDLTDPPLDFHPTRQLRGMLIARDIYYHITPNADAERANLAAEFRERLGKYEPPIFETLVAWTYRYTGGESIAVPRVYDTVFWLLASIALYALARRFSSDTAALVTLAFFLVLPFSVQASRSFQPDPLMTSLFIGGFYFLYRWVEEKTWRWAILAASFLGFAALVKIVIAFFIAPLAIAAVLLSYGIKRFWKSPQVWTMAFLIATPAFVYYIVSTGENSSEFFFNRTIEMLGLLTSTKFYLHWMTFIGSLFGLPILYLSFLGTVFMPPRGRILTLSLWLGYFLYGISLPFQIYTHSYYHIQLIPLVALGLAPLAKPVLEAIPQQKFWKLVLASVLLVGIAYPSWVARSILVAKNFRNEPAFWEKVADAIPTDKNTVALTQDYGYRLMYFGWRKVALWPLSTKMMEVRGNSIDAQAEFDKLAKGKGYFLVTAFGQLKQQPGLQEILAQYPVLSEGDGYIIYDLRPPK